MGAKRGSNDLVPEPNSISRLKLKVIRPTIVCKKQQPKKESSSRRHDEGCRRCWLHDISHGHTFQRKYHFEEDVDDIGCGSSGCVRLCRNRLTAEVFACKIIAKANLSEVDVKALRQEVVTLRLLRTTEEVITLYDVFEDHSSVYLVMEYCSGGDLFDKVLENRRGYLEEAEAVKIMRQIMRMLNVCKAYGVMHRDLKPENLVFATKDRDSLLKLIDLGLATMHFENERHTDVVGTCSYLAPEVIKQDYGNEVDMWSAGVVAYSLLSGDLPFGQVVKHIKKEYEKIHKDILEAPLQLHGGRWSHISEDAKSFLSQILERNPQARLTPDEALNHPWLNTTPLNGGQTHA